MRFGYGITVVLLNKNMNCVSVDSRSEEKSKRNPFSTCWALSEGSFPPSEGSFPPMPDYGTMHKYLIDR